MEIDNIDDHLKPLSFDDFDRIARFLQKYPCENSNMNICSIFSWSLFLQSSYMFYQDRFVLCNPKKDFFVFPIGEELPVEDFLKLHSAFKKAYPNIAVFDVPEKYINAHSALSECFDIQNDEGLNDYIYTAENLVKLSGKKLAKKKNLISQFLRAYPDFSVKKIEANDFAEIMDFCRYWKNRQERASETIDVEFEAIQIVFSHWDLFPCEGVKLYAGGKLCAFSIYSPQSGDMATIHYEKYDPEIKGSGQVINQETAKILLQDFVYINREHDLGVEGMRQAKRSYQPIKMLPYYKLKAK